MILGLNPNSLTLDISLMMQYVTSLLPIVKIGIISLDIGEALFLFSRKLIILHIIIHAINHTIVRVSLECLTIREFKDSQAIRIEQMF